MLKADRLRQCMKAAKLTQSELARRTGLTQPTIYRLVHGHAYGSAQLHVIARELRTTPAYLTGETDDPDADVPDAPEYSREEVQWVQYWRALNEDEKRTMVDLIELLMAARERGSPMAKAA